MIPKVRRLPDNQLRDFDKYGTKYSSCATTVLQGTYLKELSNLGVKPRSKEYDILGCVITHPSGSELAIETAYNKPGRAIDKGDLHIVNTRSKTLTSYYRGWGNWEGYYGDRHWDHKDYLKK